jgi:hypothetical protein
MDTKLPVVFSPDSEWQQNIDPTNLVPISDITDASLDLLHIWRDTGTGYLYIK